MPIISTWPVMVKDKIMPAGTTITLSEEEEASLVEGGYAEYADDGPLPVDLLTPGQFVELSPDEQKKHLAGLQIEPASNKENRLQQYTDWYDAQGE